MTIIWQDGFDGYVSQPDFQTIYAATSISADNTHGRFGEGCAAIVSWGLGKPLGSLQTDMWSSFGMTINSVPSSNKVIAIFGSSASPNGGTELMITYNGTTGVLTVFRGYLGTSLATVIVAISVGWHWFDIRHKISSSVGEVEVWIDNDQKISLTGVNTQQNSGFSIEYVAIGDPVAGGSVQGYYDDWLIYDASTSRLGDSRIETTLPNSDAGPNDGTPVTGTDHFAMVDTAQYNPSDYITLPNVTNDAEVFGTPGITDVPTVIHAVRVYTIAQKTDAGAFGLKPMVVSAGVEFASPSVSLTTGWAYQSFVIETDPNTGFAWTLSAVNITKIGAKVT